MNCKGDRRPRRTGEAGNSPHWSLMGNILLALTWGQDFHFREHRSMGLIGRCARHVPSHDSVLRSFTSLSLRVYPSPSNCPVDDCILTNGWLCLCLTLCRNCHHSLWWKWRQSSVEAYFSSVPIHCYFDIERYQEKQGTVYIYQRNQNWNGKERKGKELVTKSEPLEVHEAKYNMNFMSHHN